MKPYIDKVREFHLKHDFAHNNGHNMFYRLALLTEELGEICACVSKGKPKEELAEEHADLLILLLGNCIAADIDIEAAFHKKMERLMKRPVRILENGFIRVTEYGKEEEDKVL